jgi:translocation and assembly module TamB
MYELYPGLRGRTYGYLNVQAQPRLKATANLVVDNFGFGDISVKKYKYWENSQLLTPHQRH